MIQIGKLLDGPAAGMTVLSTMASFKPPAKAEVDDVAISVAAEKAASNFFMFFSGFVQTCKKTYRCLVKKQLLNFSSLHQPSNLAIFEKAA
jgi:hypothetical protein